MMTRDKLFTKAHRRHVQTEERDETFKLTYYSFGLKKLQIQRWKTII